MSPPAGAGFACDQRHVTQTLLSLSNGDLSQTLLWKRHQTLHGPPVVSPCPSSTQSLSWVSDLGAKNIEKRVFYTNIRDIPTDQELIRLWWPHGVCDSTVQSLHTSQQMKIPTESIRFPFTLWTLHHGEGKSVPTKQAVRTPIAFHSLLKLELKIKTKFCSCLFPQVYKHYNTDLFILKQDLKLFSYLPECYTS